MECLCLNTMLVLYKARVSKGGLPVEGTRCVVGNEERRGGGESDRISVPRLLKKAAFKFIKPNTLTPRPKKIHVITFH